MLESGLLTHEHGSLSSSGDRGSSTSVVYGSNRRNPPDRTEYAQTSLGFEGKYRASINGPIAVFPYCQRRTKCKILSAHEWLLGAVENLYDEPQNVPGGRMAQLIK